MDTALYRHFDATGRLLYVGIALSPASRTSQHRRTASWFSQVIRIEIEWFVSREGAELAEREAIRTERPLYNRAHKITLIEIRREDEMQRRERIKRQQAGRKRVAEQVAALTSSHDHAR